MGVLLGTPARKPARDGRRFSISVPAGALQAQPVAVLRPRGAHLSEQLSQLFLGRVLSRGPGVEDIACGVGQNALAYAFGRRDLEGTPMNAEMSFRSAEISTRAHALGHDGVPRAMSHSRGMPSAMTWSKTRNSDATSRMPPRQTRGGAPATDDPDFCGDPSAKFQIVYGAAIGEEAYAGPAKSSRRTLTAPDPRDRRCRSPLRTVRSRPAFHRDSCPRKSDATLTRTIAGLPGAAATSLRGKRST